MKVKQTRFIKAALAIFTVLALGMVSTAQAQTACGANVCYTYDELGRLTRAEYSSGITEDYTYDPAGNRTLHLVTGIPTLPVIVVPLNGFTIIPLFASTDDIPGFAITAGAAVTEGSAVTFTVSKSGTTSLNHTVDYTTASGTALSGTDFTAKTGTLSFASTDTQKTFTVNTTQDTESEQVESFLANLSNPSNFATISLSQATGVINDDDGGGGGSGSDTVLTDQDGNVLAAHQALYDNEQVCTYYPFPVNINICDYSLWLVSSGTEVAAGTLGGITFLEVGYSNPDTPGKKVAVQPALYGDEP